MLSLRNLFSVIISLTLLMQYLLLEPFIVHAQNGISEKRIIALIYDDSGSMRFNQTGSSFENAKWGYANYALQSLTGLLGNNDRLMITRMSSPERITEIRLDGARQVEIDRICSEEPPLPNTGTPFLAVETAMDKLCSLPRDENCQYWLVLLTDGNFNEDNLDLAAKIDEFKNKMGSAKLNFVFVAIGDNVSSDMKAQWKTATGRYALEARDTGNIIEKMNEVAALITSRDPAANNNSVLAPQFNQKEVILQSDFPLRRVTILKQSPEDFKPDIDFVDINGKRAENLRFDGPFILQKPQYLYFNDIQMHGSVTHILQRDDRDAVPSGQYRIYFKNDISGLKDKICFLAEAAVDFKVDFIHEEDGTTVKSGQDDVYPGETIKMEVRLTEAGSDEPLAIDKIKDYAKRISVSTLTVSNKTNLQYDPAGKCFTGSFILSEGKTDVVAAVNIAGFYQAEKSYSFQAFGSSRHVLGLILENPQWSAPVNKLKDAPPLRLIPTIDGTPMTVEQFQMFRDKLNCQAKRLNIEITPEGQGFLLKPGSYWGTPFTAVGDVPVTVTLKGKSRYESAQETFTIHIEDISLWKKYGPLLLMFLALLFLAWWIVGIIVKPRFKKDSAYIAYSNRQVIRGRQIGKGVESTESLQGSFLKRWLLPYRPERITIQNLTFEAGKRSEYIVIPKEIQNPEMTIGGRKLGEESGINDCSLYQNEEVTVNYDKFVETYKYMI